MWNRIIDQKRVVETIQRSLDRERVAHAYLFHGPDGVGKRAVGLAMARALECTQQKAVPCEECTACRKTRRMVHPDVHVLFPYPKDTDDDDVARRIQRLGDNPYAAVDYVRRPSLDNPSDSSNKQVMYHVDRVRDDLIKPMSYRPSEGKYKVVLITDAEQMNETAANAFLKLLEEPPPQTVFLLTTSRTEQLLPTILSRCQRIRFDPLQAESIEAALIEKEDMDPDRAAMLARMADGSYSRALELARSDDLMTSRSLVLDYFRAAYTGKIAKINDHVNELSSRGRERVKSVLELMLRWIRDLILYREMEDDAPLVNVDQKKAVVNFVSRLPDADLKGMVGLVEEAIYLAERNVHLSLILTTLAHRLRDAMHGRETRSVYVPLPEADLHRVEGKPGGG